MVLALISVVLVLLASGFGRELVLLLVFVDLVPRAGEFGRSKFFQECVGLKSGCEVLKARTKPYVASHSVGVYIMHTHMYALGPEAVRRP